jgi:hypothetical protein
MTLIIYLIIFFSVFTGRSYFLRGRHLKDKDGVLDYVVHGKHGNFTRYSVGIRIDDTLPFIIRREKWYHRFFKFLGLAHEVDVPDEDLGKELFFITDRPDHLADALHSPALLEQLRQLFALPVETLYCTNGRLWFKPKGKDKNLNLSDFARHTEILRRIETELKKIQLDDIHTAKPVRRLLAFGFIAVHAAFLVLAISGGLPILFEPTEIIDHGKLFAIALLGAFAVSFIWLLLIILAFARTSFFTWVLGDFLVFGLAGLIFTTGFMLREVNVVFDESEVMVRVQQTVTKNCSLKCKRSGRRASTNTYVLSEAQCTNRAETLATYKASHGDCRNSSWFSYKVFVQSWAKSQKKPFKFDTNGDIYDRTAIGGYFEIPTHAGRLKIEWVDLDNIKPAD